MSYALLFDLDGVLVDSRELHFEALNLALGEVDSKYVISADEQATTYEGLTTKVKLEILNKTRGLPTNKFEEVWQSKQSHTAELFKSLEEDSELIAIFKMIKDEGFQIGVVSNSIRQTLDVCLNRLGIAEYVDLSLSNEEVLEVKPSPSGYKMAMIGLKSDTLTTAIFEDSIVGRLAAERSGAKLVPVDSRSDLTEGLVKQTMEELQQPEAPMFSLLIPMAGAGSRFVEKGYEDPKPMIDVNGKPMIQNVIYSLDMNGHYIYLAQEAVAEKYGLQKFLEDICPLAPKVTVIGVDGLTDGAASTSLLAKELINNENPLVICNSDQLVDWNSITFLQETGEKNLDGCIVVFRSDDPKWSYAKVGDDGLVTEVAEKQVISDLATVGIYYWKHGSDYVKFAEQMIKKDIRTNGEFYICPTYNEAIASGLKIGTYEVDRMISLGTPEDLEAYVNG
jgi:beta-phosphoglucomutase-like phosphatase (HAD superfamily)/dTDP-glucose pyrophosphorylase